MVNEIYQRLERLYSSDKFPWVIICLGIALRLIRYLHNPSLNFDEAGNATIIADSTISDLTSISPDATLTYPLTFQIFTKLAIQLLGNTEYALRLYPLILGIAALFLFYYVAKKYISPKVVPATLLLFAILNSPVYYSSMVKPYSGDIFFALLIFAALVFCQSKNFNQPRIFLLAIVGAVAIWFSNPSVFVLAGIGTSLIISSLTKKEWSRIGGLAAIYLTWAGSFILYYVVFLRNIMANIGNDVNEIIKKEAAFIPFPPESLADIKWIIDTFFDTFNFVDTFDFHQGLTLTGIGAMLFIAGCIYMYSKNKDRFFILVSPILVTLAAAALHQYPFKGRLILFLIPFFLLVIAEGIAFIHEKTRNNSKAIITIIVILLFIYPLSWAAYNVKKPVSTEEIKPALQYIKDNWQEGDIIYVHFYAQYAFDYYLNYHPEPFSFVEDEHIIGIAPRGWYRMWKKNLVSKYYDTNETVTQSSTDILKVYIKDLDKLMGCKRVWILFSGSISSTKGMRDSSFFLYYLDTKGQRIDSIQGVASAYLYDLSGQSAITE